MSEHPILFSTEMVKAILDGRKTQTRRVIKPQPDAAWMEWIIKNNETNEVESDENPDGVVPMVGTKVIHCPYGQAGDRLWVRETWNAMCFDGDDGLYKWYDEIKPADRGKVTDVVYKANRNPEDEPYPWIPSIFMPRWASRITLEVVNVRVERVQDITNEDAKAEGLKPIRAMKAHHFTTGETFDSYRIPFESLWYSINGKRPGCSWDDNPFVWCVTFNVVK